MGTRLSERKRLLVLLDSALLEVKALENNPDVFQRDFQLVNARVELAAARQLWLEFVDRGIDAPMSICGIS